MKWVNKGCTVNYYSKIFKNGWLMFIVYSLLEPAEEAFLGITLAEEVKDPGKNVYYALMGSTILVGLV